MCCSQLGSYPEAVARGEIIVHPFNNSDILAWNRDLLYKFAWCTQTLHAFEVTLFSILWSFVVCLDAVIEILTSCQDPKASPLRTRSLELIGVFEVWAFVIVFFWLLWLLSMNMCFNFYFSLAGWYPCWILYSYLKPLNMCWVSFYSPNFEHMLKARAWSPISRICLVGTRCPHTANVRSACPDDLAFFRSFFQLQNARTAP